MPMFHNNNSSWMQNSLVRDDALAIGAAWLSKPPYFQCNKIQHFLNESCWMPIIRFICHKTITQPTVSQQHNTTKWSFKKKKKNLGHCWKWFQTHYPRPQGGCFIGLLFLLWQCKMKPLTPAGSSRASMAAKINTAISEQDLSGVQFFSEVTEEQLHLSGKFNCET